MSKPRGTTGILFGYSPSQNISQLSLEFGVTPTDKKVILDIFLSFRGTGEYAYFITLPYNVRAINTTPRDEKWLVLNGESGSIVMVRFLHNQSDGGFESRRLVASLDIIEPIVQSNFGTYTLDLPLGGSLSPEISQLVDELPTRVPLMGNNHPILVSLNLPNGAFITEQTHSISRRDFINRTNTIYQSFDFPLERLEPFFTQYFVPAEANRYERNLFSGGLLLGIGIPLTVSSASEYLRRRSNGNNFTESNKTNNSSQIRASVRG